MVNEIQLVISPVNEKARELMPEGMTRIFPAEMRLAQIDNLVKLYFLAEGLMGSGEEYDVKARIPGSHPDAQEAYTQY